MAPDQLERMLQEVRSQARQEADFVHEQLLGVLLHELRTPLTPILAWAQLLRRTSEPARIAQGADVIERNVRTQMALIDDVLDINRIDRHSLILDRRRHDLGLLLQEAVQSMETAVSEKGVTLVHTPMRPNTISCNVEGERIKQIVSYLLANAVRFTPSGGSVTVTLERDADIAILAVRDTGLGIAQTELPFVFDAFRAQSSGRSQGTTGIQLALARRLADLHGGALEALSSGTGAEFRLRVPIAIPAAGSDPS
jgi:signal transduction histidine kinase